MLNSSAPTRAVVLVSCVRLPFNLCQRVSLWHYLPVYCAAKYIHFVFHPHDYSSMLARCSHSFIHCMPNCMRSLCSTCRKFMTTKCCLMLIKLPERFCTIVRLATCKTVITEQKMFATFVCTWFGAFLARRRVSLILCGAKNVLFKSAHRRDLHTKYSFGLEKLFSLRWDLINNLLMAPTTDQLQCTLATIQIHAIFRPKHIHFHMSQRSKATEVTFNFNLTQHTMDTDNVAMHANT